MSDSNEDLNFCYFVNSTWDDCCYGCDKPGIGAENHNPADNQCSDCALLCCPCAFICDIFCFVPRCFKRTKNRCCSKTNDSV